MRVINKCLAEEYPNLMEEWDFSKNTINPYYIAPKSGKKAWWICKTCSDSWEACIANRSNGSKCPYCNGTSVGRFNNLVYKSPKLAAEWHPTKNGNLAPCDIYYKSNVKVWWICSKGHEWETSASIRQKGCGCRFCSGKVVNGTNSLALCNPKLASEWHPTKNGNLTPYDVTKKSGRTVWWTCSQGHSWQAKVLTRSYGHGCPYCSGRYAIKENSLAICNPKLASEWHPTKNGNLTPCDVTRGSSRIVFWKCKNDHEWSEPISWRLKSKSNKGKFSSGIYGCPYCSHQKVTRATSLYAVDPLLSEEWHPTKNGNLTPCNVFPKSGKKVWWMCAEGHEWYATVYSRSNGNNCPLCSKIYIPKYDVYCRSNTEAFFYLKLKEQNKDFVYEGRYSSFRNQYVYDFYIPSDNMYIEVTGYSSRWKYWIKYLRRIVLKKRFVIQYLKARFKFIQYSLTIDDFKYLNRHVVRF
ncbi:MAG TPA: zinc-ribbon domain-containing protein [Methanosarcinales archaeon]|nr:zinc-ribbon domain-containing protein [Methanosarcinales archaeon]